MIGTGKAKKSAYLEAIWRRACATPFTLRLSKRDAHRLRQELYRFRVHQKRSGEDPELLDLMEDVSIEFKAEPFDEEMVLMSIGAGEMDKLLKGIVKEFEPEFQPEYIDEELAQRSLAELEGKLGEVVETEYFRKG
jgi:hypothetical protein